MRSRSAEPSDTSTSEAGHARTNLRPLRIVSSSTPARLADGLGPKILPYAQVRCAPGSGSPAPAGTGRIRRMARLSGHDGTQARSAIQVTGKVSGFDAFATGISRRARGAN